MENVPETFQGILIRNIPYEACDQKVPGTFKWNLGGNLIRIN